ncbi:2-succinylbenzoate--CoA ligase [Leptodesmis sp.]|uniref:2-succinylbenzoate--CoA ligase n=1 Tax=Leptodesmis sp. TaxID=3100501 RepID=UPI00405350AA
MKTPLTYLQQQTKADWLIGHSSQKVLSLTEHLIQQLLTYPQPDPGEPFKILLVHRDPVQFLAHFIAACTVPSHLFLCNPDWAATEWQQVLELVQPDLIWQDGTIEIQNSKFKIQNSDQSFVIRHSSLLENQEPRTKDQRNSKLQTPASKIAIPTGGSSGKIRFVIHTWDTLMASVRGFQQHFEVEQVNCCCVLPMYHVSGLMQIMRSLTSSGQLAIVPFKTFASGHFPNFDPQTFFLSLVPTQLHRLLQDRRFTETPLPSTHSPHHSITPPSTPSPLLPQSPIPNPQSPFLSYFKAILLGGAPTWPELLNQARELRLPLAPTYGMTETASQVATLKPAEFLQGKTGVGQVLPHVQIQICNNQGDRLPANQPGLIHIYSHSLALSYYPPLPTPHSPLPTPFYPDDIGYLDADGYLHLLGRNSDKMITGGENVFPAEVEAAIQATGLVRDVYVMGVSDRHWGQAITAFYSPLDPDLQIDSLKAALQTRLSKFKHPKHWIAMASLPRNAQGKINQAHLRAWVADHYPALADHQCTETASV